MKKTSLQIVTAPMKLKDACSFGRKATTNLDSILKSRDITLLTRVHTVKAMIFPAVMHACESWAMHRRQNAEELMFLDCGAEKIIESPLDYKEIKLDSPKGNQP